MPLQNRVAPNGLIFADAARGTFMGNRGGVLHNEERELVRRYAGRRWLVCVLEFKDRHRVVMSPKRYTELFFLDEAVALAAGHRPCAECRRERFSAFKATWPSPHASVDEIDRELHSARIDERRGKVTYEAAVESLPDGCFISVDGESFLVWGDSLLLWSPGGYLESRRRPEDGMVQVLTPAPIVRSIGRGYTPAIHESAKRLLSV
jgi:hypothetical protein